jgi:N6-adenosine-specific RNA methylase IME4
MIERLYPNVPKLEMFARKPRDGWDVWGNEVT